VRADGSSSTSLRLAPLILSRLLEALQVADQACLLHRRRVVMERPAADLLDYPEARERAYLCALGRNYPLEWSASGPVPRAGT
jgi:hypothetical protein